MNDDLDTLIEKHQWNLIPFRLQSNAVEAQYEDIFSQTPLHRMCSLRPYSNLPLNPFVATHDSYQDYIRAISALINVYPKAVFHTDEDGRTPLHHVCANSGNPQIVTMLLSAAVVTPTKTAAAATLVREGEEAKEQLLYLVRARSRHERNTALHDLCRWGNWGEITIEEQYPFVSIADEEIPSYNFNIDAAFENNNNMGRRRVDNQLQVLKLLLHVDPMAANIRNRMGITSFYLLFGYWIEKHSQKMAVLDTIRFCKKYKWDIELSRRWNGIVTMIQMTATRAEFSIPSLRERSSKILTTKSTSTLTSYHYKHNNNKPLINKTIHTSTNTSQQIHDHYLFLHASISADRTWPVFHLILHMYSHQCHIKGKPNGMLDEFHGDYPLAIAARTFMQPTTSLSVISALLLKSSSKAVQQLTSQGDSLLCCAIRGGKTWSHNFKKIENGQCMSSSVLKLILDADPNALRQRDKKTGLYPFMLAAVSDLTSLETVFNLLRESPDLVGARVGVLDESTNSCVKKKSDLVTKKSFCDGKEFELYRFTPRQIRLTAATTMIVCIGSILIYQS